MLALGMLTCISQAMKQINEISLLPAKLVAMNVEGTSFLPPLVLRTSVSSVEPGRIEVGSSTRRKPPPP